MPKRFLNLIIIGGGQAGLAAAYYAQKCNLRYMVLESEDDIGNSWRYRYDSLKLFTPRIYSRLPGLTIQGEPSGYPTKDEIADYLKQYAERFNLNVYTNQQVQEVTNINRELFEVTTRRTTYQSKAVVIASGPFQKPRVPIWATHIEGVTQLHSSQYRNPIQVTGKNVLIVGGGNSGAQIAEELAASHKVSLAVNKKLRFVPAKILGRSVIWWSEVLGLLKVPVHSFRAKKIRQREDPIIGTEMRKLLKNNVIRLRPKAVAIKNGGIVFQDGSEAQFSTVIWCTGFDTDYSWLHITEALNDLGEPIQHEGKTVVKGLYFLGLSWLRYRNSALIGGVGNDAKVIIKDIKK